MRGPTTDPFLRRMTLSDLPAVMEVDRRSLSTPWSEKIWRDELQSPFGLYLVLEQGKEVIGQIGVRSVLEELRRRKEARWERAARRGFTGGTRKDPPKGRGS